MNFKCALSIEELEKRTHKDYLLTKKMLKKDAPEFQNLADGDKKALSYLVKSARIIEKINMELDSHYNLPFKKYLEEEVKKGNKQAELTKILFDAQRGIIGIDSESKPVILLKGAEILEGKAFYPADLTKEELASILKKMLKNGKQSGVKNILSQRTIVKREGAELKAIDYTEAFKADCNETKY